MRRRLSAGALAAGRPRRASGPLHARVLAPPALLVGLARQRLDVRRRSGRRSYDANADLVLVGHDHDYERFAPQDAGGRRDLERGIREFVVGTGGKNLRPFPRVSPNSEARDATSLGVLELTLGANAYEWRFRAAVGSFTDSGSASCH